jgi:hypothetical protein
VSLFGRPGFLCRTLLCKSGFVFGLFLPAPRRFSSLFLGLLFAGALPFFLQINTLSRPSVYTQLVVFGLEQ